MADLDREIVRLAFPAFLALVSEPLFLLADSSIVGHLGTAQLAGLGIAGAVLQSAAGLFVFLAYGTTASVARRIGAGDRAAALSQGIDGLWLAMTLGAAGTLLTVPLAGWTVRLFHPAPAVAGYATTYLRLAVLGLVPLLVVLAATGVLRGLQDTRTPLVVAVAANLANIALNVALVYGAHLGIAGSAVGSDLAQLASAAALGVVVVRAARRDGVPLRPNLRGVLAAAHAGVALVVRTLTLRASLLVVTAAAATLGSTAVATHQLALTIWTFLSFALDAVAIAAQAMTGRFLGAGDAAMVRRVTARMTTWGWAGGLLTGVLLALAAPLLGPLFTTDPAVRDQLARLLLVVALFQPVAGVVFVLDGVLIGAGDGRYLAAGGVVVLAVFAPLGWLAVHVGTDPVAALRWLWVAFGIGFLGSRAVVLLARARGDRWLVTGVAARS